MNLPSRLFTLIFLLLANFVAAAGVPIYPEAEGFPSQAERLKGQDATPQALRIGPISTLFWLNLRTIISDEENLLHFERVVGILNLKIKDPVDSISLYSAVGAYRTDIEEPTFRAKEISYAIFRHSHSDASRDVVLQIEFNLEQICLAAGEVERVYGKGALAITAHDLLKAKENSSELETHYSIGYPVLPRSEWPTSLVFSFAPSGCAERLQIRKSLKK